MNNVVAESIQAKDCGLWPAYEKDTYEYLNNSRTLVLNKVIEDDVIEGIVLQILRWNDEDSIRAETYTDFDRTGDPITLLINTDGGRVDETLAVIGAIENSITPVVTWNIGKAYSGGFLIYLAGHKRVTNKYSSFMYHQLSGGNYGKLYDMSERIEEQHKKQKIMDDFVLSKTKIPKARLKKVNDKKFDWWITPEESIYLGISDYIIGPSKKDASTKKKGK